MRGTGIRWDEEKAGGNLTKHRVSFLYRVVFTWRSENLIRIISAQKASRDERKIYHRTTLS